MSTSYTRILDVSTLVSRFSRWYHIGNINVNVILRYFLSIDISSSSIYAVIFAWSTHFHKNRQLFLIVVCSFVVFLPFVEIEIMVKRPDFLTPYLGHFINIWSIKETRKGNKIYLKIIWFLRDFYFQNINYLNRDISRQIDVPDSIRWNPG